MLPTLGDSYTSDQLAAGLAQALIAVGSWRNTHASQNWLTELYVPAALGGGAVDMETALRYGMPNGRAAWARALNEYAWADMPEFERALEAAAENRSLYKWRVKRIVCPWSSKYNGFAESVAAHMPVMNNLMAMAMGLRY
ncbi:MAG: hypothetical protein EOO41_01230 [Methanobacteriota archaeon]|nr:MAG: hypothetical protein EOO41_01230 [Euryarchaeota archaeon]